ncbi:MAG: hypothetical protein KDC35_20295 [Acidobacteria bacterium]|nr:hypothetical protein [Acidobacteriota bacterium]
MRKWLNIIVLVLFLGSVLVSAISAIGQRVDVQLLLPWVRLDDVALGVVMFLFMAYGAAAVILVALLDRARLVQINKKSAVRLAELEREVKELRRLTSGEPAS